MAWAEPGWEDVAAGVKGGMGWAGWAAMGWAGWAAKGWAEAAVMGLG